MSELHDLADVRPSGWFVGKRSWSRIRNGHGQVRRQQGQGCARWCLHTGSVGLLLEIPAPLTAVRCLSAGDSSQFAKATPDAKWTPVRGQAGRRVKLGVCAGRTTVKCGGRRSPGWSSPGVRPKPPARHRCRPGPGRRSARPAQPSAPRRRSSTQPVRARRRRCCAGTPPRVRGHRTHAADSKSRPAPSARPGTGRRSRAGGGRQRRGGCRRCGRPRPGRWCRPGSPSAEASLQVLIDAPGHICRTTLDRADEGESAGLGSRHRAIRRRCVRRSDDVESLTRAHAVPAELLGQISGVLRDRQVPTVHRTHDQDCTVGKRTRPNARVRRTKPRRSYSRDAPHIRSGPGAAQHWR